MPENLRRGYFFRTHPVGLPFIRSQRCDGSMLLDVGKLLVIICALLFCMFCAKQCMQIKLSGLLGQVCSLLSRWLSFLKQSDELLMLYVLYINSYNQV